jgi:sugar (pentulose or hexulose) kinase
MTILSSILNIKVTLTKGNYGGAMGAAILAMSGYSKKPIDYFCNKIIKIDKSFLPQKNKVDYYLKKYNN